MGGGSAGGTESTELSVSPPPTYTNTKDVGERV